MKKLTDRQLYAIVKAGIDCIKKGDEDGAIEFLLQVPAHQRMYVKRSLKNAIELIESRKVDVERMAHNVGCTCGDCPSDDDV